MPVWFESKPGPRRSGRNGKQSSRSNAEPNVKPSSEIYFDSEHRTERTTAEAEAPYQAKPQKRILGAQYCV